MSNLIGKLFRDEISIDELLAALDRQGVTDTVGRMGVDTTLVSDYTLEHRKVSMSSTPLTDTGALTNHITAVIRKKGGAS